MKPIVPLVIGALVLAGLGGCLDYLAEDRAAAGALNLAGLMPHQTQDPLVPAKGNNRLHLHADGDALWMDTRSDGPADPIHGVLTPTSPDAWHTFPLQPTVAREVTFADGPATLRVPTTGGVVLGTPPAVQARLVAGDLVVATGSSTSVGGTAEISLPVPPWLGAGEALRLEVCVCRTGLSLYADYAIHTGQDAWLDLPVLTPVYVPRADAADPPATPPIDAFERTESAVETFERAGQWFATRRVTLTNPVDASRPLDVALATVAGGIQLRGQAGAAYTTVVHLEARGDTREAALERLEGLTVGHRDEVHNGVRRVMTEADALSWQDRSARIEAAFPPDVPIRRAEATTRSGGVTVRDLTGDALHASTDSGGVTGRGLAFAAVEAESTSGGVEIRDGVHERLHLRTNSGGITVTGRVNALEARSNSGGVTVNAEHTAPARYVLETHSGGVRATLAGGQGVAYDAKGGAASGGVTIDLPGTQPVGEQSDQARHVRSADFDAAPRPIQIAATATSGGVRIGT